MPSTTALPVAIGLSAVLGLYTLAAAPAFAAGDATVITLTQIGCW